MKKILTALILALFIILLFPSFGLSERAIQVKTKRFALIIGNGAYKNIVALKTPINDANDRALARQGLHYSDRRRRLRI